MKQVYILTLLYIIFIYLNNAYIRLYPSIPVYPDNKKELKIVKKLISKRNKDDINFFYKTNNSVSAAFLPYVDLDQNYIDNIVYSQKYIIRFFKYLINRKRPYQLGIKPIDISTAQTPSYPAGHSYQAYLVAKKLSKIYPQKKQLFYKIAIKCDMCRVKAGLHYPSDGVFSRKLVDYFNP